MTGPGPLREQLARFLDWEEAHVGWRKVFGDFPPELRGRRPEGCPHSAWQLLEHLRIGQRDLLEFCREEAYVAPNWPDDYWPSEAEPPAEDAWGQSLDAFRTDLQALQELALDPELDLLEVVPTGTPGQTYLRALLLAADHTAYHVGQVVLLRRRLGIWPP